MTIMILLMGEQPAANLLPARRLRPEKVVVVHSAWTKAHATRLGRVLAGVEVMPIPVDPYAIDLIAADIRHAVAEAGWRAPDLLFNLTGGTKPMSLAAYNIAQELGAPFLYFQTEGGLSRIYHYVFDADRRPQTKAVDDVPESIALDDYLQLYLDDYQAYEESQTDPGRDSGADFEVAVGQALRNAGLEVKCNLYPKREGAVEIDLVFRAGNQFGLMEVKLKAGKKGIDQLVAAGSQRYLGTYIARFVVSTQPLDRNNLNLAEAHRVTPIILSGYAIGRRALEPADRDALLAAVLARLNPPPKGRPTT